MLIAAFAGITVYIVIFLLFQAEGQRREKVKRRINSIGKAQKKSETIENELNKSLFERIFKPFLKSMAGRFENRGAGMNPVKQKKNSKLSKMLNQAGFALSPAEYNVIRILVAGGCLVLFLMVGVLAAAEPANIILLAVSGGFVGYVGTRYYLKSAITKRKRKMELQLPEVLDLLSVSVEAGLGFEQAINHLINNMEGPLIDELTVSSREMTMGRSRRDALQLLGERCNIEELSNFVGALIQASQLGISIKNVLQSQAAALRQGRKIKAQEKAMKVSIKMLFPMLIFIFPVVFIVTLGPAIINLITLFSS
jgi:tight adherence protein C